MIVLRFKEPDVERPYRVTGYPVVPLVFCCVCGFLIYNAVEYAVVVLQKPWIVGVPLAIMLMGVPIYLITTYAFHSSSFREEGAVILFLSEIGSL